MSNELRSAVCGGFQDEYLCRKQDSRFDGLVMFEDRFNQLFAKPLHLYCNRSTGFDPRPFWDEFAPNTSDGVSYDMAIRSMYGDEAADMIYSLIGTIEL